MWNCQIYVTYFLRCALISALISSLDWSCFLANINSWAPWEKVTKISMMCGSNVGGEESSTTSDSDSLQCSEMLVMFGTMLALVTNTVLALPTIIISNIGIDLDPVPVDPDVLMM